MMHKALRLQHLGVYHPIHYFTVCQLRRSNSRGTGKAQADSLRKTREETPAKVIIGDKVQTVSSSGLKKGDIFICEAGDTIPADGEIIEGLASIDESAITGESAPVIREAGGDKSSVTGGTKAFPIRSVYR